MTAPRADADSAALVVAAQAGDASAWEELVTRFQDAAVALAMGHGHWNDAEDVAQEAFMLAMQNVGNLADPRAFPGWFATLVRTASSRRHRSTRLTVALTEAELAAADTSDPTSGVEQRQGADAVRTAVESLPPHERAVIALHYLGGLQHRHVADFLGISESATKKRAWSARNRLKELLPMVATALSDARPSRDDRFRETILLFAAIRDTDPAAVKALLAKNPDLIHAREDWSFAEGVASQLGHAAAASPLIRAAGIGSLEIVRLLVEAGAAVNDPCECDGAESALWTAVSFGHRDIAEYLLERGADPNDAAFEGATPLHAAVISGHHDLTGLLLDAGADPDRTDEGGRRPADWVGVVTARRSPPTLDDFVPTALRGVDLFAPLRRGALVHLPPAHGLGQAVVLFQIADHLQPAGFWHIGFEYGAFTAWHVEHGSQETGVPVTVRLVPTNSDATSGRAAFGEVLREVLSNDEPKLVVCQQVPGHTHDVTLALPELASSESVLATFVTEPFTGEYPPVPDAVPEGFDARIAFTGARAEAGLWPAIDPQRTVSRHWPDGRHERLSAAARSLLSTYEQQDRTLSLPDPETFDDPASAARAQSLIRYLAQPMRIAEIATSIPGERTDYVQLLDDIETMLGGTRA